MGLRMGRGRTATRPQTTTPGLKPVTFAHGEIYANPRHHAALARRMPISTLRAGLQPPSRTISRDRMGVAFNQRETGVNKPLWPLAIRARRRGGDPSIPAVRWT